jgi:autotransporter-associated beta strand protein
MTGGSLAVGASEYVGDSGIGTITQSGGTNSSPNFLYLGNTTGSRGTYNLSGSGQLTAGTEYIGNYGTGSFLQSGGTNGVFYLDLGTNSGSSGTYSLSGIAQLTARTEYVGNYGTGSFLQSGGTNGVLYLDLGTYSGSSGTYNLSGSGQLTAGTEYIGSPFAGGSGAFLQTAGTNTVSLLSITRFGSYMLGGGGLQVDGIVNQGILAGGAAPARLVDSGILDLTVGSWQSLGNVNLSMGDSSLLIVPVGFDPSSYGFSVFSHSGMIHTAGTPLAVAAGHGFGGAGIIADAVDCQGSILAASGGISLSGGLTISGTGLVDLAAGVLTTDGQGSRITAGSLTAAYHGIGYRSTGSFSQSGGTSHITDYLYVGYAYSGTYNLSGSGCFSGTHEFVGYSGTGTFNQSGGTNNCTTLDVGLQGGRGTYNLSGSGYLAGVYESVGELSSTGSFNQSAGTNNISSYLWVGDSSSSGTYNLNGGVLTVAQVIGNSHGGTFNLNGGTLQAGGSTPYFFHDLKLANVQLGGAIIDVQGFSDTISQNLLHDPSLGAVPDGGLTKLGTGVLKMTGTNTYIGTTTISQGELIVDGSIAGPVTVNSGGILAGTGSISSGTVNASGQIAPGESLTVIGNLSLGSGAVMDYELDTPSTSDRILTANLALNGQQISDFNFTLTANFAPGTYNLIEVGSVPSGSLGTNTSGMIGGYPAYLAISGNEVVLNVVPEPSMWALLGAGAIGLWLDSWQRRRQSRRQD